MSPTTDTTATSLSTASTLEARGLRKDYGAGEGLVRAVDGVNLDIAPGETVAVMGPSGCRKSTLLHLLGGLDRPSGGEVWLAGRRIDQMGEKALARMRRTAVGFVFQSFHLMAAVENVELSALVAGRSPRVARRRADEPGVVGHSGPYPVISAELTTNDVSSPVQAEGRDATAASIDQPELTEGRRVNEGEVVVEAAFADALGLHAR